MSGWPTLPLGSLCDFKNGLWTGKKPPFVEARVLRNTNFSRDGKLDYSDVAILQVEANQLTSRRLQPGDIILEKSGGGPKQPVGRVVLFDDPNGVYSFSNFTSVIRIRDQRSLFPGFLHLFLHSQYVAGVTEQMQKHTTGIRNLEFDSYKAIEVPIPPLAEQKRIVAILDEAFEGITKATASAERNLANARELIDGTCDALIQRASENAEPVSLATLLERGWIVSHLDGNHGSDYPKKEEFISTGVPYISANAIDDDTIDMSAAKFLSPTRADRIRKGVARNGDVIFAHNATVGPVAILSTEEPRVILGTSLTHYRCDQNYINNRYLAHYMRSRIFRSQYEQVMRQSTRNQVPITKQREFTHIIPDPTTQRAISARLDELDQASRSLRILYEEKIMKLSELRKVLLHRAFSGQLTDKEALAA